MKYSVYIVPTALKMIKEVSDRRIQKKIAERIDDLEDDPELRGKPLVGELSGYRSMRAVGQRYRIIYRIDKRGVIVYVVAAGIRKEGGKHNIYELTKRLLKLRLIDIRSTKKKI